jgi:hypothetical protein
MAVPEKYVYYIDKGKWCSEPIVVPVLCSGQRCGGTGRCGVADIERK